MAKYRVTIEIAQLRKMVDPKVYAIAIEIDAGSMSDAQILDRLTAHCTVILRRIRYLEPEAVEVG